MKSAKLELVIHSAQALKDTKHFSRMNPVVTAWVAGDGKKIKKKTPIAENGDCNPSWECSMHFPITSINSKYVLFFKIEHIGSLTARPIGKVQVPFADLLKAGDAQGWCRAAYKITIPSGNTHGVIVVSHKFSEVVVNSDSGSGSSKKDGSSKKKVTRQAGAPPPGSENYAPPPRNPAPPPRSENYAPPPRNPAPPPRSENYAPPPRNPAPPPRRENPAPPPRNAAPPQRRGNPAPPQTGNQGPPQTIENNGQVNMSATVVQQETGYDVTADIALGVDTVATAALLVDALEIDEYDDEDEEEEEEDDEEEDDDDDDDEEDEDDDEE